MAQTKVLRGTYSEVLNKFHFDAEYLNVIRTFGMDIKAMLEKLRQPLPGYLSKMNALIADIYRASFFKSSDKSYTDFLTDLLCKNITEDYLQGNLDASVFDMYFNYFGMYSKKF